jgi:MinD-like ATPase involved in chromosome partitioning or flagellar assembly
MTVGVIVAIRGDREAAIASQLGAHPDLVISRRCADLGEALAAAHAGVGSVAVVSEQSQLNRAVVAEFASAGVAVVGAPSSIDAVEYFENLGVLHLILPDHTPEQMTSCVVVAAADAPDIEDVPDAPALAADAPVGLVVAVWGPTGAPGRTTLAVNIAAECAERVGNALVVDVDTYGGAVAQALGLLDEAPGIAALARASLQGTLNDAVVVRHALAVAPGFRVLSGLSRPDRWPELSAAALEPVWEMLRKHAAVTVLDCGFSIESDEDRAYDTRAPQRNGATLSALAAADVILVVGGSEPLGVQRLVQALTDLDRADTRAEATRMVVVNRLRSSVAGSRPHEAVADALRRYAGVEQVWAVPHDAKACDAATLSGQSLKERAPRSSARKAIAVIAQAVVARIPSATPSGFADADAVPTAKARVPAANLTD